MKKIFLFLLIIVLLFCSCRGEQPQEPGCERPMMFYDGIYWVNPHIPLKELPEGYEYSGTVSEEMAYNTGLEGIGYFTKEGSGDFYTYQMTGTYIGGNTVDTTKQAMHYVQWIPVNSDE